MIIEFWWDRNQIKKKKEYAGLHGINYVLARIKEEWVSEKLASSI